MKFAATIALLMFTGASGFAPMLGAQQASSTALNMAPEEGVKKAAAAFVAAAFLMSNAALVPPALAVNDMDFGSSQLVAGRSGGRAGGRSSAARSSYRAAPSTSSRSTTRVIQRTTYVNPSPVIVAPPPVVSYGYNPVPGIGKSSNSKKNLSSSRCLRQLLTL